MVGSNGARQESQNLHAASLIQEIKDSSGSPFNIHNKFLSYDINLIKKYVIE